MTDSKKPPSMDGPTKERFAKGDLVIEPRLINENTGEILRVGARSMNTSALQWYYGREVVTESQFDAGIQFKKLWHASAPRTKQSTSMWDTFVSRGCVGSVPLMDDLTDTEKWQRFKAAMGVLDKGATNPNEATVTIGVCLYDQMVPGGTDRARNRHIRLLCGGLSALRQHFRIG